MVCGIALHPLLHTLQILGFGEQPKVEDATVATIAATTRSSNAGPVLRVSVQMLLSTGKLVRTLLSSHLVKQQRHVYGNCEWEGEECVQLWNHPLDSAMYLSLRARKRCLHNIETVETFRLRSCGNVASKQSIKYGTET